MFLLSIFPNLQTPLPEDIVRETEIRERSWAEWNSTSYRHGVIFEDVHRIASAFPSSLVFEHIFPFTVS